MSSLSSVICREILQRFTDWDTPAGRDSVSHLLTYLIFLIEKITKYTLSLSEYFRAPSCVLLNALAFHPDWDK